MRLTADEIMMTDFRFGVGGSFCPSQANMYE